MKDEVKTTSKKHALAFVISSLILLTSSFVLLARPEQYLITITASTNASATAVFTNGISNNQADGDLRRIVVTLSAGLTNVDIAVKDWDGTSFFSTNSVAGSTNATASFTWTAAAGADPAHWFIITTANAKKFSTNNTGVITFTVTQDGE